MPTLTSLQSLTPSSAHLLPSSTFSHLSSPQLLSFSNTPFPRPSSLIRLFSSLQRFQALKSQRRPEANVGEDTDEMFDDLLDKYGKVVFRSNSQKPPTAEADDDAESLSFAVALAEVANEVKAADLRVLFVKPLVYWTRFFIIATAFSRLKLMPWRMCFKIRDAAEKKFGKCAIGDTKPNSWTLLDFGDVVVHIFLPPQREFYNLEEFYANATPIDLPFETQSSFRN